MKRWKPEDWFNGYYEILMEFEDPYAWMEAAQVLWSQPQLTGIWTGRDFDADADRRLDISDAAVVCELLTRHLNGIARLPNGKSAPCGTGISVSNTLVFFLPLADLAHCYDVGIYPFGDVGRPWVSEVDQWLAELGAAVFRKVPFRVAAVGSELSTLDMVQTFNGEAPKERLCGLLAPAGPELRWYPPILPRPE